MKLMLLGTTGYHPCNTRHTACMMLPELGVIFDAGTAMFRVRDYLETDELDIFLSHSHLDHIFGLTFLLDVLFEKNVKRVTIHGREQDLQAVEEHLFAPALFPVKLEHELRPLNGPISISDPTGKNSGKMTYFPLEHPGGAMGYRLDLDDFSLAYVTDTTAEPHADYLKHIQGVDVLLHECYFSDELADFAKLTGHSTITPVAEVAKAADVGMLLLIHINPLGEEYGEPDVEIARKIFPNTEMALDLMTLEF